MVRVKCSETIIGKHCVPVCWASSWIISMSSQWPHCLAQHYGLFGKGRKIGNIPILQILLNYNSMTVKYYIKWSTYGLNKQPKKAVYFSVDYSIKIYFFFYITRDIWSWNVMCWLCWLLHQLIICHTTLSSKAYFFGYFSCWGCSFLCQDTCSRLKF